MTSKTLNLKASLVSKITGFNKYTSQDEVESELVASNPWLKPVLGVAAANREGDTATQLTRMTADELRSTAVELGLPPDSDRAAVVARLRQQMRDCIDCSTSTDSRTKLSGYLDNKPVLRQQLGQAMERDIRVNRGCSRENGDLDRFCESFKIPVVQRNAQLYRECLMQIGNVRVIVNGRVDGISQCGAWLVETKHRRNGFFEKIPVYERVQLETYFWLTGIEQAYHVQNYDGEQRCQIYRHDRDLWQSVVDRVANYVKQMVSA